MTYIADKDPEFLAFEQERAERLEALYADMFGENWEERADYGIRYFGTLDFDLYDEGDDPVTVAAMDETCEHGMAAWLCMGPMHYPSREQEMRHEYF